MSDSQWEDPPARRVYLQGAEIRALLLTLNNGIHDLNDDNLVWGRLYAKLGGDAAFAALMSDD